MHKIAITGPESTGKSRLAEELARHYKTTWVPEYARNFLVGKTPIYTLQMLDEIALGQIRSEEEFQKLGTDFLFYDTDMTVMKIWSEHAFGLCSPIIESLFEKQSYDLYLLMDIDLNWEPDPLRQHPHLRNYFLEKYIETLEKSGFPFKVVSGYGEARTQMAIKYIDNHFIR